MIAIGVAFPLFMDLFDTKKAQNVVAIRFDSIRLDLMSQNQSLTAKA
jgi:hypothetical protein